MVILNPAQSPPHSEEEGAVGYQSSPVPIPSAGSPQCPDSFPNSAGGSLGLSSSPIASLDSMPVARKVSKFSRLLGVLPGLPFGAAAFPSVVETAISEEDSDDDEEPPQPKLRRHTAWDPVPAAEFAVKTINPIRRIVDAMTVPPNPKKKALKLQLGDPTLTGTMNAPEEVTDAILVSLSSGKYNGYGPAVGLKEAREAVSSMITCPQAPVTADDVIMSSGCSHALQLAIEALAGPGKNILVPRPGFPLYATLMRPLDIEDRQYNLLMTKNWEVDLDHLEGLIDDNTAAIIVNNPSNPCGAVYSKQHLQDILKLAHRYKIPIIADEIYGCLTFGGAQYIPMANLEPQVPILQCDGIAKRYLVPGWRLGWLVVHDRYDAFAKVRPALHQLATKIVGPCALIQGALPAILKNTPREFFDKIAGIIELNAKVAYEILDDSPGLFPVKPQGAMYMMVGFRMQEFPAFTDQMEFIQKLISEESIYCLPAEAFGSADPGFRLVLTYPDHVTRDACNRIREFCERHFVPAGGQRFFDLRDDDLDMQTTPKPRRKGLDMFSKMVAKLQSERET